MSTRRKRPGGNPARAVSSTGLKIEARHKYGAAIPTPKPGQHLWIVTGCWQVVDPTADRFELDVETLLTVDGPGCWVCEEIWTPELAAKPCQGEPPIAGRRTI